MAKMSDVLGRLEAFTFSIFIFVIGYIQMASSKNVETYASAQIFYSAGSTGVQILQQVFVADTTNLLNRALFSAIPDTPFLLTVWIGPLLAQFFLDDLTWRWGYGIWAVILPIAFLPLGLSLYFSQKKAKRLKLVPPSPFAGLNTKAVLKRLWYDLDVFGLLLLSAAIALILLPLTLAPILNESWSSSSMITMLAVGGVCLVAFPFWERSKRLAPKAFFPPNLFRQRTLLSGVTLAFFYYSASNHLPPPLHHHEWIVTNSTMI